MPSETDPLFDYVVHGGDELALARAQVSHLSGCLETEVAENRRLRDRVMELERILFSTMVTP